MISIYRLFARTRPGFPFVRSNVQVDGPDKLEERVVLRFDLPFLLPVIPPHKLAHEDLDLEQGKVETNTGPLAKRKALIHYVSPASLIGVEMLAYGT